MGKYDDIIHKTYVKSARRKHMPVSDRAAQFGQFAALSGHEEAIVETARLTDKKKELDETEKLIINNKLMYLAENMFKDGALITYFKPDEYKSGGEYITVSGIIKKLKINEQVIIMHDDLIIPLCDIIDIKIQSLEEQI